MKQDRVTPEVQELLPDYVADVRECLESVSQILLQADRGEVTTESVQELFRGMHIIKGGSGLMGFAVAGGLAHAAEDLLGSIKRGELSFTPAVVSALLGAHDTLRDMLGELEAQGETATDPGRAIEVLRSAQAGQPPAGETSAAARAPSQSPEAPPSGSEDSEVLREFFVESWELIDELDQDLVSLEESPGDAELLNKIFRAAHTLKGSSSFLGFQQINEVTHRVEDVFNKLRKGEMTLTPEAMDVILVAVDRVRKLLEAAQAGEKGPSVDDVLSSLSAAVDEGRPRRLGEILVEDEGIPRGVVDEALKNKPSDKPLGQVLVETAVVSPEAVERSLAKQSRPKPAQTEQTIRVDVDRLDALMNLVGELVLGKNRLARLRGELEERWDGEPVVEQLGETTAQIDLVASELQRAVMKTRLVPIDKVFRKFPRMVRDLARTLNKEIRLEIQGESTELDKSVVEVIGDPLVHLIRNSADHGVELPDARQQAGKPREGRIRLSACHEGNHIVVAIEDDGKGMDPEVIKKKAVEKGLLSAQEAASMGAKEALNLIFTPGFSLAAKVTSVSGRGVGMDVVKTNIQQLNGLIEIDSAPGRGTLIQVRIPLTLAIIQALLVKTRNEIYAVPLVSVIETVRISNGEVRTVDRCPVLRLRDQVVPLVFLVLLFGLKRAPGERPERQYVVVLGLADKQVGVVVDSLVGEEEVVIKSLGRYLTDTPGIAGATIRGDGRVTLIVDVNQILAIASRQRNQGTARMAA